MMRATATRHAVAWIAAEAEGESKDRDCWAGPASGEMHEQLPVPRKPPRRVESPVSRGASLRREDPSTALRTGGASAPPHGLPAHQFPARPYAAEAAGDEEIDQQRRRAYRSRTVALLRRYMKYSIETGRLPSVLGSEFFRAQVTSYTVVTFEDRVIFVHDMEICLGRLDEFSRELIARHILQEHDPYHTAKLLGCNEKTVRRMTPLALDQLSEILVDAGLLEEIGENAKNSCQEGARAKSR